MHLRRFTQAAKGELRRSQSVTSQLLRSDSDSFGQSPRDNQLNRIKRRKFKWNNTDIIEKLQQLKDGKLKLKVFTIYLKEHYNR